MLCYMFMIDQTVCLSWWVIVCNLCQMKSDCGCCVSTCFEFLYLCVCVSMVSSMVHLFFSCCRSCFWSAMACVPPCSKEPHTMRAKWLAAAWCYRVSQEKGQRLPCPLAFPAIDSSRNQRKMWAVLTWKFAGLCLFEYAVHIMDFLNLEQQHFWSKEVASFWFG